MRLPESPRQFSDGLAYVLEWLAEVLAAVAGNQYQRNIEAIMRQIMRQSGTIGRHGLDLLQRNQQCINDGIAGDEDPIGVHAFFEEIIPRTRGRREMQVGQT